MSKTQETLPSEGPNIALRTSSSGLSTSDSERQTLPSISTNSQHCPASTGALAPESGPSLAHIGPSSGSLAPASEARSASQLGPNTLPAGTLDSGPSSSPVPALPSVGLKVTELGELERRMIRQDMLLGVLPEELETKYKLQPGALREWLLSMAADQPPAARRQLALMRLDRFAARLMEQAESDDQESVRLAASAFVNLQKREAALTGLDQPVKQETDVRVQVAWLQPGRLSYRDGIELAEDIAVKALPSAEGSSSVPDSK